MSSALKYMYVYAIRKVLMTIDMMNLTVNYLNVSFVAQ